MTNNVLNPVKTSKTELKFQLEEEKQVIIHCSMACMPGISVRIWKTTYLITEDGKKIPLVFWEGISLFPEWTNLYHSGIFHFTLIFSGLPTGCNVFSMLEEINEPGGFVVKNITRNKKDVYKIQL